MTSVLTLSIREAVLSDASGIARVHIDSWRTTYRGLVPESYLSNLSYSDREEGWKRALENGRNFVFVAEDSSDAGKEIVGFASGGSVRSHDPEYKGELYAVYLLSSYQRSGIGRRLVSKIAESLVGEGYGSMLVWVLAKNPSRQFYEKLGGTLLRSQPIEIGGSKFEEVSYGWKNLTSFSK